VSAPSNTLLSSIKLSRLLLPVIIGLGGVVYLMYTQLDFEEIRQLTWTGSTTFWLVCAVICYVLRHCFYAWRLQVMTGGFFGFLKSMQLIGIWEFSSAISPTNIGGSGVALYFLSKEKLSVARTVTIVLYSMILDTLIFIVLMPLFYILFGSLVIRPEGDPNTLGFVSTFWTVLAAMFAYGLFFYIGLFLRPGAISKTIIFFANIPLLRRFRASLEKTAADIPIAAEEIKKQNWSYHFWSTLHTLGAWVLRFVAISCIIIAIVPGVEAGWFDHVILCLRGMAMHVITTFSPTPGGSGVSEYLFGGFYGDYVPTGISSLVALVWRLNTYYPYLLLGAMIIPIWIRSLDQRAD